MRLAWYIQSVLSLSDIWTIAIDKRLVPRTIVGCTRTVCSLSYQSSRRYEALSLPAMKMPSQFAGRESPPSMGNISTLYLTIARDSPPEELANIICLGCGDPRNVLYTVSSLIMVSIAHLPISFFHLPHLDVLINFNLPTVPNVWSACRLYVLSVGLETRIDYSIYCTPRSAVVPQD